MLHDLEAIKNRVSISGLVAKRVKLRRAGRDLKGLCPFHDEKTPSFVVSDVKRNYHCYGCGAHGDIFDWMVAFDGCTKGEAIRMLAEGGDVVAAAPAARREGFGKARAEVALVDSGVVAAWLWRNRLPAIGSIVEAYCASRGLSIDGPFGREALSRLGFHPRAPVVAWPEGGDVAQAKVRAPAMLAAMVEDGRVRGVHATYLRPDGRGKASLPGGRPSRKMWGLLGGRAVWLSGRPGEGAVPLIVGEGIETCWSYAQDRAWPVRCAAALSLDNLQGGIDVDRDGAIAWWRPQAALDRPGFVDRDAGEVRLLVDADMKPIERRVRRAKGAKAEAMTLTAADRARLCADVGAQHWRHAGAGSVTAVRPPMGMDFNDAGRMGL
ncbi:MAG: hypothetical protein CMN72_09595 [Sphingomonas sp.]|nr:hypothetical protein [Sphingomonas sp.]